MTPRELAEIAMLVSDSGEHISPIGVELCYEGEDGKVSTFFLRSNGDAFNPYFVRNTFGGEEFNVRSMQEVESVIRQSHTTR